MRGRGCSRRRVLGVLAVCAVAGWRLGPASAQPPRKPTPPVRRVSTVVIDPGHGGVDPGAISQDGVCEKEIVLEAARE